MNTLAFRTVPSDHVHAWSKWDENEHWACGCGEIRKSHFMPDATYFTRTISSTSSNPIDITKHVTNWKFNAPLYFGGSGAYTAPSVTYSYTSI